MFGWGGPFDLVFWLSCLFCWLFGVIWYFISFGCGGCIVLELFVVWVVS